MSGGGPSVIVDRMIVASCQRWWMVGLLWAASPTWAAESEAPSEIERTEEQNAAQRAFAAVREVMAEKQPQIIRCYEARLNGTPDLGGRIQVEMELSSGVITRLRVVEDTVGDASLQDCVVRNLRDWTYPEDVSDTLLVPFGFNSPGSREKAAAAIRPAGGAAAVEAAAEEGIRLGDEPVILGALAKGRVAQVVQANLAGLEDCYEEGLAEDPELAGKVDIRFMIGQDGAVANAEVRDTTLGSDAVEQCLTERFLEFTFSAPSGGIVMVTYPLIFSPG